MINAVEPAEGRNVESQVRLDVAMVGSAMGPAGSSDPGSDEDRLLEHLHNLKAVMRGASGHVASPRHPDGTPIVPLTEGQRYENIAFLWLDGPGACHDEILRVRRRGAVDVPRDEQAVRFIGGDHGSDERLIRAAMGSESCRTVTRDAPQDSSFRGEAHAKHVGQALPTRRGE